MTNTTVTTRHGSTSLWTPGDQVSLGSYSTHAQAQSVVEYLADQKFEVETTQIIGTDLRMVEQITGRLTWPRALFGGIVSGAWFGLFVGLLLNILTTASFGRAMAFGLTWGVIFGGIFAAVSYGLVRGRRDFTSMSAVVPSRFDVLVAAEHSERARGILAASPR
jgi:hypothetical protein